MQVVQIDPCEQPALEAVVGLSDRPSLFIASFARSRPHLFSIDLQPH